MVEDTKVNLKMIKSMDRGKYSEKMAEGMKENESMDIFRGKESHTLMMGENMKGHLKRENFQALA